MTPEEIVRLRVSNQQLSQSSFQTPAEVVSWLGAVQAQDFMGGKWAIGRRLQNCSEAAIHTAITKKEIVRTWPMRGTLHFVSPTDIRWMIRLLAVRMIPRMAPRLKQLELDDQTLKKGSELLVSMLQGGNSKTREEIYTEFESHGIHSANQRGLHIIGKAAHDGLVCFGAPVGKQQTFVLIDEWLPKSKEYSREESLGMLADRYFTSHGPATLADFVWWTGLSVGDARESVEIAKSSLSEMRIGNISYWVGRNAPSSSRATEGILLLPPFDEYLVGYKDRRFALEQSHDAKSESAIQYLLSPTVISSGSVVGLWRREMKTETVVITVSPFRPLTNKEKQSLREDATGYADFFGKKLICSSS